MVLVWILLNAGNAAAGHMTVAIPNGAGGEEGVAWITIY